MNSSDIFNESILFSQPPSLIDLLALWHEAGVYARKIIKQTLTARYTHRTYEMYLFGNPGGDEPYRRDGATRGMSCAEIYQTWRKSVLDILRSTSVPKHLMLQFLASPDGLIDHCFREKDRAAQLKEALTNCDRALGVLLDVIKNIPQPPAIVASQEGTLAPPIQTASLHTLRAGMEDRRLVIYVGEHMLVSKHRLAYNGNPHKLLRSMVTNKGQMLTNKKVGLPNSLKLSNVVQGIGFKGLIHRKLLDCSVHTVTLKEVALINDLELRELLALCQDTFDSQ